MTTEISDNVSDYIDKLKKLTEKQAELIRRGVAPETVALTQRNYTDRTNAYRASELHIFDRAWKAFQPQYLMPILGKVTKGPKTIWYIPRP